MLLPQKKKYENASDTHSRGGMEKEKGRERKKRAMGYGGERGVIAGWGGGISCVWCVGVAHNITQLWKKKKGGGGPCEEISGASSSSLSLVGCLAVGWVRMARNGEGGRGGEASLSFSLLKGR